MENKIDEVASYEQFICAAIAYYKTKMTITELMEIIDMYKTCNPDSLVEIGDFVRANSVIDINHDFVALKSDFSLDSEVFVRGKTITLKDYLCGIAGEKMITFMKNTNISLNDGNPAR